MLLLKHYNGNITMSTQRFIALEGLEGAGKSTILNIIKAEMLAQGLEVVFTREPGGTPLAERIRNIVVQPDPNETMCAETELLLMYAARMQHVNHLIKPYLAQAKWVVSDRFNWSSLAYQGGGRSLSYGRVKALNDLLLSEFAPALVIYLDIDPELGLQRAKSRQALDRIEQEKLDFFERARDIFNHLVDHHPNAYRVDASQPLEQVQAQVLQILRDYIQTIAD